MKVIIKDLKKFKEGLALINPLIQVNAVLPVLKGIAIKAFDNKIVLVGTDMEQYGLFSMEAQVVEPGKIVVESKMFVSILNNLDGELELSVDKLDKLIINAGKDNYKLTTFPYGDYVAFPMSSLDSIKEQHILASDLYNGIFYTSFAIKPKNFSPVLTGMLFNKEKEDLYFVGTDSFRLSEYKTKIGDNVDDFNVIIPSLALNKLFPIIKYFQSKGGEVFTMKIMENMVLFSCEVKGVLIEFLTLVIQGAFPNYKTILPVVSEKFIVDKTVLEKALKKIAIYTRDINNFTQFSLRGNVLKLSSGDTDKGEVKVEIEVNNVSGGEIDVAINGGYITELLKVVQKDVTFEYGTTTDKPVLFKCLNNNEFIHIIRPLMK